MGKNSGEERWRQPALVFNPEVWHPLAVFWPLGLSVPQPFGLKKQTLPPARPTRIFSTEKRRSTLPPPSAESPTPPLTVLLAEITGRRPGNGRLPPVRLRFPAEPPPWPRPRKRPRCPSARPLPSPRPYSPKCTSIVCFRVFLARPSSTPPFGLVADRFRDALHFPGSQIAPRANSLVQQNRYLL